MLKNKSKKLIFMGLFCVLFLVASVIYSILFNGSRWVEPMYLSTYSGHLADGNGNVFQKRGVVRNLHAYIYLFNLRTCSVPEQLSVISL